MRRRWTWPYSFAAPGRRQEFQGSWIYWHALTGAHNLQGTIREVAGSIPRQDTQTWAIGKRLVIVDLYTI
ncbi:hypothetical protein AB0H20_14885 [Nocardia fluminea]|uniref:hypothetical protein n=1 Tax=Nocardia fluminea TaxID=134984 RepID=UPI0034064093